MTRSGSVEQARLATPTPLEFQFRATAFVARVRLDVSVAPRKEDTVSHVVNF